MSSEPKSRASQIVLTIEDDVLKGRLPPGERLDERRLAERFGVSRTPVREALQRLAAGGVVTLNARHAASVAQLDIPDLLDAFTVTAELEAISARLAARRFPISLREELEKAHRECAAAARTGEHEAFNDANDRFHAVILEGSRNRLLQAQIRSAQLATAPYRRRSTYQPGRMTASIAEHQAVVDAILSSDAEAAARHMRQHVSLLAQEAADFLHHLRQSMPASV